MGRLSQPIGRMVLDAALRQPREAAATPRALAALAARFIRSQTIAWAMRDQAFTPAVLDELWLGTFPGAAVLWLADAAHVVQEDAQFLEIVFPPA